MMPEHFLDPRSSFSAEPNETPFNRAYKTDLSLFDWYKIEENKPYLRRFNLAMFGSRKLEPENAILSGKCHQIATLFWHKLEADIVAYRVSMAGFT